MSAVRGAAVTGARALGVPARFLPARVDPHGHPVAARVWALDEAAQWIKTYRRRWEGRLAWLGTYFERRKGP
jgi:hypothetical protein